MPTRLVAFIAVAIALPASALPSQDEARPAHGERLESIRLQNGLPAMAIRGFAWDTEAGKIATIATAEAGVRAESSEAATEPGDLWHIGSCTKAITATLLATYVAEGKLAWTDTLADALPDLAGDMSETAANATIADLLRHRAGMPPNPTGVLTLRLYSTDAREGREAAILEALAEATNAPGPGEQSRYSNFGYMVAGVIAEQIGGKPYETLVVERVLEPLGIDEGEHGFGPPPAGDDLATPAQPVGHRAAPGQGSGSGWTPQPPTRQPGGPPSDNPPAFGPAGTMHLTLDAWGRFCMAHARGDDLADGERDALGLRREDYAELHRPVETFACGWVVAPRRWAGDGDNEAEFEGEGEGEGENGGVVGIALTHNGSNTMWFASAWIAPERDWVMLTATNAAGPKGALACDQAIGIALSALTDTVTADSGGQAGPEQREDEAGQ